MLGWTAAAATITNLVDVQTRIAVAVPGGTKTRKHFVFETGPFTVRMVMLLVLIMRVVTTIATATAPRMVRTIFNIGDFRGVRGIDNKGLGGFGERIIPRMGPPFGIHHTLIVGVKGQFIL